MEFSALSLIAEISAALAGFATLAGVVRHDELDADGIFAIVLNCLIAMLFALIAILLVGPAGIGSQALRPLSAALLLAFVLALWREVNVYRLSWRDMPERREGGLGGVFGIGAIVSMPLPALLAAVVVMGVFPARAAMLYELAVLSHLLVAIFLLLYVVWRNFALRSQTRTP